MDEHRCPLGDDNCSDAPLMRAPNKPTGDLRVGFDEQSAGSLQCQHDDGRRNLPPRFGLRTFVRGIEADLLGCGFGQLATDWISLIDDDHDRVVGVESTVDSPTEHDGDGVSVGIEQMQARWSAGVHVGHWVGTILKAGWLTSVGRFYDGRSSRRSPAFVPPGWAAPTTPTP